MKGLFQTDKGQVRNHNEDDGGVFYNGSGQLLAVIADGMGGHQAGDVASKLATSFIQEKWEYISGLNSRKEIEEWLTTTLQEVNRAIIARSKDYKVYEGMGTTIVAAVCTYDFTAVAHIGDSRCYLLDGNDFNQLTEDHSLVNELARSGQISQDEAEYHPRKNVLLKALGTDIDICPDVTFADWTSSDNHLLLCSDGLTDKLSDEELKRFLENDEELESMTRHMIQLANERGGEDNISLVVVHHNGALKAGDRNAQWSPAE